MKILSTMVYNKAKFIRALSYVMVGLFFGLSSYLFAVVALAAGIVFDALATAAEIKFDPSQNGKRVKAVRVSAPVDID